eukprot:2934926-Pyramimonas_sp.AAC.1
MLKDPQGPTKVATIAQFAAPQGSREVSAGCVYNSTPLGLPRAHERGDNCAVRGHPKEPRGLGWVR